MDDWFVGAPNSMNQSPYMEYTSHTVNDKQASMIPAVLHGADKTARVQTVHREWSPRLRALLAVFFALTGDKFSPFVFFSDGSL